MRQANPANERCLVTAVPQLMPPVARGFCMLWVGCWDVR